MPRKKKRPRFSKREQEMMDIIYGAGSATAAEVMEGMTSPPSYSAVRATLRILEEKGHLKHASRDGRYVYRPTVDREKARISALDHIRETFFDGSVTGVVSTLLERSAREMSDEDLDRLSELIEHARKEGR